MPDWLKQEDNRAEAKKQDVANPKAPRLVKTEPKPEKKKRERVYERYTFSLTPDVNADIDSLSLFPRDFRTNRSDVIKAGIEALKLMSKQEVISLLKQVK
ncbi:MAG: hypothetical protein OEX19_05415 [Gammaproteobacteria bacterium]|nr:hypothetical protein [Gammaproteobacteria bacterium]